MILSLAILFAPTVEVPSERDTPFVFCIPQLVVTVQNQAHEVTTDRIILWNDGDERWLEIRSSCARPFRFGVIRWSASCDDPCIDVSPAFGITPGLAEIRQQKIDSAPYAPLAWQDYSVSTIRAMSGCLPGRMERVCRVEWEACPMSDLTGDCRVTLADAAELAGWSARNRLEMFAWMQNEWKGN